MQISRNETKVEHQCRPILFFIVGDYIDTPHKRLVLKKSGTCATFFKYES